MSILYIDTDNAYLVVLDLLSDEKRALISRTASGPLAFPHLEGVAERLSVVVRKGKPYANELSAADKEHDVGCVVLDYVCRIHETLAVLPRFAHLTDRAVQVRGTLSMERAITSATYGQSAANAHRNRRALPEVEDTLERMPAAEDVTARDVAELFIGGGERIGELLARRADALAAARAAKAEASGPNLLHEAREIIGRLRTTLEAEVSWRDDLPRDLVDRIFSVLDERIAAAAAAVNRPARGADAPAGAAAGAEAPIDGEGIDGTERPAPDVDGGASEAASGEADADSGSARRPLDPRGGD